MQEEWRYEEEHIIPLAGLKTWKFTEKNPFHHFLAKNRTKAPHHSMGSTVPGTKPAMTVHKSRYAPEFFRPPHYRAGPSKTFPTLPPHPLPPQIPRQIPVC